MGGAASAQAERVDIALVLALDESGSVNPHRWNVQRQGYANAFRDKRVVNAILEKSTAITLVQWSGARSQWQTIPWRVLDSKNRIEDVAARLQTLARMSFFGDTAIGSVISFAIALFEESGFTARRQIIDISGDGIHYVSLTDAYLPIELSVARARAIEKGITINGLPIKVPRAELSSFNLYIDEYYRNFVIGGPHAFIETVSDGNDVEAFTRALVKKIVRELLADAR